MLCSSNLTAQLSCGALGNNDNLALLGRIFPSSSLPQRDKYSLRADAANQSRTIVLLMIGDL